MKINVLIAASECVPFIKTGGLADVVGSLPKYFNKRRYDVRVILPKYTCIPEQWKEKMQYITHFYTGFNFQEQYVGLFRLEHEGVIFYFIDSEYYFSGPWPYGSGEGSMPWDIEKFAFFSQNVLSCLKQIDWKPDIIHCNDWQTGLIPVYLNDRFQGDVFYHKIKTVFTIHNLRYQGVYDIETVKWRTGLSDYYFTSDKLEAYESGNLLKGGLVYSDRITTVSPSYAEEIKGDFYGEGMNGLLRARSDVVSGILNGIDTDSYDPESDPNVPFHYGPDDAVRMKAENKKYLQKQLNLRKDPNAFMIGIVSRLTGQKGIDLIDCVMEEICSREDIQLVVLGTGDGHYENLFRNYAEKYPERVSANIFYSEGLSRQIYASCDAFLMPSLFEPCGLSQLMALRYGTLPIVRETGGLKDTVEPYDEVKNRGTGFSFRNYNAHEMLGVIEYANSVYRLHRGRWDEMVVRAMNADFSWKRSAIAYQKLYDGLIREREEELKKC